MQISIGSETLSYEGRPFFLCRAVLLRGGTWVFYAVAVSDNQGASTEQLRDNYGKWLAPRLAHTGMCRVSYVIINASLIFRPFSRTMGSPALPTSPFRPHLFSPRPLKALNSEAFRVDASAGLRADYP